MQFLRDKIAVNEHAEFLLPRDSSEEVIQQLKTRGLETQILEEDINK